MSDTTPDVADAQPLITGVPSGIISYVLILAALISAAIHLWLVPVIVGSAQTQAILFVLASLGLLVGVVAYVTRYWQREFYVGAALFALALLIAYFVMGGPMNTMAIISKVSEAILVVGAGYLYWTSEQMASERTF